MAPDLTAWTAMVLSGGRSSRMGSDKADAILGLRTLLQRVVESIPADVTCIVVGPAAPDVPREVALAVEPVPGGGPVSGMACGLEQVTTPLVAVLAVDMPFAGPIVERLVARLDEADVATDGVIAVDGSGRRQQLVAAYRTGALRAAIASLDGPRNRAVREVQALLEMREVPVDPGEAKGLLDIDTPHDLASARRSLRSDDQSKGRTGMDEWVAAACTALDIEAGVDVDAILDLARECAHGVERPAAPVSTYLMGYAVAAGMDPAEAAARLTSLAREWPSPA